MFALLFIFIYQVLAQILFHQFAGSGNIQVEIQVGTGSKIVRELVKIQVTAQVIAELVGMDVL